jgi:hypothetical protein
LLGIRHKDPLSFGQNDGLRGDVNQRCKILKVPLRA